MKPISEQDHYEILEISRDATGEEIERSFRMAQSTYADDSLAGYSVFDTGDTEALRERIAIAHRVLSDPESRRAYDAALYGADVSAHPSRAASGGIDLPELPELPDPSERVSVTPPEPAAHTAFDDQDPFEEDDGEFDGPRLRRSRLHRGMELEDISRVTKINPVYLQFIEEGRFAELPAPVYVRGFVAAYADCVGLDSKRVASSYMRTFESATGHSRRGRFLGSH